MELLGLVAVSVTVGVLALCVAPLVGERLSWLAVILSGVGGTVLVWVIYRLAESEEKTWVADWPHWAVSLSAGALLLLNAVVMTRDL